MFYASSFDQALRFGDLLQGFPAATPMVEEPFPPKSFGSCMVDVAVPQFTVVMDPTCEIRNKTISLTPLIPIQRKFLDNPYFSGDLTRINRQMKPQESMSPSAWSALTQEQKQEKLAVGLGYALLNFFVFEKHDLLPMYSVKWKDKPVVETNYYMVDFRNTYKLSCPLIESPEKCPLGSKILQLSPDSRADFSKKIANYFARIQLEDNACEP